MWGYSRTVCLRVVWSSGRHVYGVCSIYHFGGLQFYQRFLTPDSFLMTYSLPYPACQPNSMAFVRAVVSACNFVGSSCKHRFAVCLF